MNVKNCCAAVSPECGVCGVGDEAMGPEEVEHGTRDVKKMQDPVKPCQSDIDDHNITHLPYRSWCAQCVMGRGKEMPHCRSAGDGVLPEIHCDFFFIGEEGEPGETIAVLVGEAGVAR